MYLHNFNHKTIEKFFNVVRIFYTGFIIIYITSLNMELNPIAHSCLIILNDIKGISFIRTYHSSLCIIIKSLIVCKTWYINSEIIFITQSYFNICCFLYFLIFIDWFYNEFKCDVFAELICVVREWEKVFTIFKHNEWEDCWIYKVYRAYGLIGILLLKRWKLINLSSKE